MWYPNIRLTRTFRLTFMILLIASFFIISPILILYTAGYRFDIGTFELKKTGVLTIEVTPKEARVSLNEIPITKSSPIRLANRAPGSYSLRIEKEGYLPWAHTVQVHSTQTTYVTDLFLFLDVLPTFEWDTSHAIETTHAPDGTFVATTHISDSDAAIYEVMLYHVPSETQTVLWRGTSSNKPILVWSRHAPLLAIVLSTPTASMIKTIDATNPDDAQTHEITPPVVPNIQWHETGQANIYIEEQKNTIYSLTNGISKPISTVSSSLWFVDDSNDVWNIADGSLWKNNLLVRSGLNDIHITDIIDTHATHIVARNTDTVFVLWLNSDTITQITASHVFPRAYGDDTSTWILWSDWEILELTEQGDIALLTRTNEPIQHVTASTKHNTLFFSFGESIVSFHPHYRTTHTLFKGKKTIHSLVADHEGNYILFETSLNNNTGIYKRLL